MDDEADVTIYSELDDDLYAEPVTLICSACGTRSIIQTTSGITQFCPTCGASEKGDDDGDDTHEVEDDDL